jgi:hypothetical protein
MRHHSLIRPTIWPTIWTAACWLGLASLLAAEDSPSWKIPVTGGCIHARAEVTVAELVSADDLLRAAGTWTASGGADGVALEYRIDSNRHQADAFSGPGAQGHWHFEEPADTVDCGPHALRVWAYPIVNEEGKQRVCLTNGTSAQKTVKISCTPRARIESCRWQCSAGSCTGSCTGTASHGHPGYVPFWGIGDVETNGPYGVGPWTHDLTCKTGERVTLRVRDGSGFGLWSQKVERICGTP